jgi:hypothetical protein
MTCSIVADASRTRPYCHRLCIIRLQHLTAFCDLSDTPAGLVQGTPAVEATHYVALFKYISGTSVVVEPVLSIGCCAYAEWLAWPR